MTADKSKKSSDNEKLTSFEKSLAKLEQLAEQLEHGDMSLEESLRAFEDGIQLTRQSQKALTKAEQKVQFLLMAGDEARLDNFNTSSEEQE